jgi:hypothetical protein
MLSGIALNTGIDAWSFGGGPPRALAEQPAPEPVKTAQPPVCDRDAQMIVKSGACTGSGSA